MFQTSICFLGYKISAGTVSILPRALEFAEKFPDEIKDKETATKIPWLFELYF